MKSKTVSIFFCAVMVASVFAPMAQNVGQQGVSASGTSSLANSPWPMFRQNLNHTGISPYDTSANPGLLKWSFTTSDGVFSSPAIDSDGTIYVGSDDYKLYAINPDSTEKWNFTTGGQVGSSPAIGSDGTIYVGSDDTKLYAIDPDGTEKWNFITGAPVWSSPAIGNDGTIYVGSDDNKLYAINPDSTEKWSFVTGGDVNSSPTIGSDGTIYIGSRDHKLYAINPDGTEKWSFSAGHWFESSPAIGSDGTIYIGSEDKKLYAINPDGTEKWNFKTDGFMLSSPAIGSDGTIYVGSFDYKLYAINPDGTEKWNFTTGWGIISSPAIGSDETIYTGSTDSKLYAINPDGTEKWNFTTGNAVKSSPAIGFDGTIYVGSRDDKLYAIGTPNLNVNVASHFSELNSAAQSLITVHVTDGTNPVQGAIVNLQMDNGGLFSPQSGTTDINGNFKSIFNAPTVTTQIICKISAEAGKTGYNNGSGYVDITMNPIPWPMFSQNCRRTGLSPYDTSANPGKLKWSFTTGGFVKSPVIGSDGTIYVGSNDEKLYAINPDGTQKWNFTIGGYMALSPAIGSDGTIYAGASYNGLFALNLDGTEKWHVITDGPVSYSPAIGADKTIYVPVRDDNLYAINPNGTEKWHFTTAKGYVGSPVIAIDGTIYVGSNEHKLYAINPDGTEKWNSTSGDMIQAAPAIGLDGTIYVGSKDNNLYAISPNGIEKWRFTAGGSICWHSSPAIAIDGTIYFGSDDHNLYAINPNGTEKWRFSANSLIQSAPAIGSEGTIYFGSDDFNLYAINPDGTEKWNFTTGRNIHSSPAIGSDGTIYVGSIDKKLYAIGTPTPNQPPAANAGPNQTVNEGNIVQFNGSASFDTDGTIETYEWDFDANVDSDGDGNTTNDIDATGPKPSHVYGDDGVYTVTLTVTDYDGLSDIDTMFVTVQNVAPAGKELLVNGDFSDGTQGWNQALHGYVSPGSIPPLPPSRYSSSTDNGYLESWVFDGYNYFYQDVEVNTMDLDFRAKFRAVDFSTSGGLVAVTVHMLSDQPPGFSGNPPSSSNLSKITSLIVGRITWYFRPDHIYQSSNTSYWELLGTGPSDWNILDVNLHDVIIVHLPEINESQVKWLRIWISTYGESGGFTIGNYDDFSLRESILIGPDLAYEGHALMFTAQVIDPGSDDLIFTWDWGDGSPPTINTHYNDAVGPDPYPSPWGNYPFNITDTVGHIYGDNGVYWVTLTVEDDDSGTTTCNTTIIVNNVAPIVDALPDATIDEGGTVAFSGHATDPGSDDLTFTWSWEYAPWGDKTSIYYNDGVEPDPYPSPTINPRNITENATCQFGDDGVFTVSLTVTDDDGASTMVTTTVTVNNVAPKVIIESATMYVEIGLRVAGRKFNDVGMTLYEDGSPVGNVSIERMPGSPNDQIAWIPITLDMTKSYSATVTYTPEEPPNIGGNPVWIFIKSENGSINKIHHTFNVQQSKKRNSEHWNHVEPWIVDLNVFLIGHAFEVTSHITDPGSDDEILSYTYGSQVVNVTYLSNPPNPDPYPSPEVNPRDIQDTTTLLYEGPGTLTLTVIDDDGGTATVTLDLI